MRPEVGTSEVGTSEAEAKWGWPPFAVVDESVWGRNKNARPKKAKTITLLPKELLNPFRNSPISHCCSRARVAVPGHSRPG